MSDQPTHKLLWLGRPVEELTREELIRALHWCASEFETLGMKTTRAKRVLGKHLTPAQSEPLSEITSH